MRVDASVTVSCAVSNRDSRYPPTHQLKVSPVFVQPIPLGVTFSNDVSKLKALTFLFTETWHKRRPNFDTPSGIGCTSQGGGK